MIANYNISLLLQLQSYSTMPYCCGRSFDYNGIRNHLDNSYTHANKIECRWCYARWPSHASKLRLKHEQDKHWYHCDDCTYIFSSQEGLQEHIDQEHPPNYCYGCKRSFQNLNNLNQVSRSLPTAFPPDTNPTSTSNLQSMSERTSSVPGVQTNSPI